MDNFTVGSAHQFLIPNEYILLLKCIEIFIVTASKLVLQDLPRCEICSLCLFHLYVLIFLLIHDRSVWRGLKYDFSV